MFHHCAGSSCYCSTAQSEDLTLQSYRWSWMDRPLSFGFPSVRLAVRSLWFLNSSGQTLVRGPTYTPRLLVQQAARPTPCYLLFQLHNATASEWLQQGGQVVLRRKGSIRRWLAKLLISPMGGCRPRGCAMSSIFPLQPARARAAVAIGIVATKKDHTSTARG